MRSSLLAFHDAYQPMRSVMQLGLLLVACCESFTLLRALQFMPRLRCVSPLRRWAYQDLRRPAFARQRVYT